MSYFEALIPLLGGIYLTFFGDKLIRADEPQPEKKKKLFKKLGYVLLGLSALYLCIAFFEA